jgi:ubiquinone/menaquinone biosynthesis C-methylase UbiE
MEPEMIQIIYCPPTTQPNPVSAAPLPDFAAIKKRQRGVWQSGDYAAVGTTIQIVGESLCEAVDLRAGERVLDVAAGNGNVALAAARRFAEVTASDYVPELLAAGRLRAEADRLPIEFREADAEALPFADGEFDVVVSVFGVMFAPDQARAAAEMVRVCRPGGRIGLANWTPDGFIGRLFQVVGRYAPPPAGVRPASLWGTPARLAELFAGRAATITASTKTFNFRYRSAEHWLEFFREVYGPMRQTFAALDAERQDALARDIRELIQEFDRGQGRGLVVPSEYLEVVVTVA